MRSKSKRAEIEERRKQVAANLLGGLNYREMAEALGVSIGTIASDVKIIMGRWEREQVESINEWVALEDRRLDRLLNALWNDALAMNFSAIDRVLSIQNQRAKLKGLYAPERREVTGADGGAVRVTQIIEGIPEGSI